MYQSARVKITGIEARIVRTPIAVPVRASFGVMRDRPAVYLRVTDTDGAEGFGEIWCNFPSVGAEHRGRLAREVVGPILIESGERELNGVFAYLMQRLHVMAIQSGEWGPFRQVAAGIDAACHDLAARKAGLPLWRFLGGSGTGKIRAYASGIGPETPVEVARAFAARGHTSFKLKVGFGTEVDRRSLGAIRSAISSDHTLLVDANQAWRPEDALAGIRICADHGAAWMEEPMAADRSLAEWTKLVERRAGGAGRRRERQPARRFQGHDRQQGIPLRSARRRQMGRCFRLPGSRETGARGRADLLPAFSRRRHRPDGLGAYSGGGRR